MKYWWGRTHAPTQQLRTASQAEFIICDYAIIERFFRSLKEECVWQTVFPDFAAAEQAITTWIRWYNTERPHQALGYRSPQEYMAEERRAQVAQAA